MKSKTLYNIAGICGIIAIIVNIYAFYILPQYFFIIIPTIIITFFGTLTLLRKEGGRT